MASHNTSPVPSPRLVSRRKSSILQRNISNASSASAGSLKPPPPPARGNRRQPSWYQDALSQGMDVSELLGDSSFSIQVNTGGGGGGGNNNASSNDVNDEEEVLEQYRLMALHEAKERVVEMLGYNPEQALDKPKAKRHNTTTGTIEEPMMPPLEYALPSPNNQVPSMVLPADYEHPITLQKILQRAKSHTQALSPVRNGNNNGSLLCKNHVNIIPTGRSVADGKKVSSDDTTEFTLQCRPCRQYYAIPQGSLLWKCPVCMMIGPATATKR